jgi:hypothetical protein
LPAASVSNSNTAIGSYAATKFGYGSNTTAIGASCLYSLIRGNATALGASCLYSLQNASSTLALGQSAGYNVIYSEYSTLIGDTCCNVATFLSGATIVGGDTLSAVTESYFSTSIGYYSGNGTTKSTNDIFIGCNNGFSGSGTTSDCIIIGSGTKLPAASTNSILIGTNITTTKPSNTVEIGNDAITDTYLKGTVHADKYQGPFFRTVENIAISTILGTTHHIVFATGAITITLPTAVGLIGREYIVKKIDTGTTTTINTTGLETIDGQSSISVTTRYESYTFTSDGSNWMII